MALGGALLGGFFEDEAHQPRGHGPRVAVEVSLHHDAALVVEARFDDRDSR